MNRRKGMPAQAPNSLPNHKDSMPAGLEAECNIRGLTRKGIPTYTSDAGWSSPVARWAHNPKVVGSNPTPATKSLNNLRDSDFSNKLP